MLTVIIGFLAFMVIFVAVSEGEWGTVGVAAVIVLLLMLASSCERKEWRAYSNFVDYWSRGGDRR